MTNAHEQFIKAQQEVLDKLAAITTETTVTDNAVYVFVYDNSELVHAVKEASAQAKQLKNAIASRARTEYIAFKNSYDSAVQSNNQARVERFGKRLADTQAQAQALYNELNPQEETMTEQYKITLDGQEPETMTETATIEYFNLLFNSEQWIFDTRTFGDELRVYATRSNYHNDDDLYEDTPQSYYDWIMTTNDDGYLIVAKLVD